MQNSLDSRNAPPEVLIAAIGGQSLAGSGFEDEEPELGFCSELEGEE